MFNVGPEKLMMVLLIALIVLGPDKLPNAARQIGKYLNEFRRISQGFQQELRSAMDVTDTTTAAAAAAASVAAAPAPQPDEDPEADVDDPATSEDPADPELGGTDPAVVSQAVADPSPTPLEQDDATVAAAADPEPSSVPNTPAAPLPTPSPEASVAEAPPSIPDQPAAPALGDLDATRAPQA